MKHTKRQTIVIAPSPSNTFYSKLLDGVPKTNLFEYDLSSAESAPPTELLNLITEASSLPGEGAQEGLMLICHLENFGQSLKALSQFEPDEAIKSLWTLFSHLRSVLEPLSAASTPHRLVFIHHGQGDFGRRQIARPADSSITFSYIAALSGMLKSITSEYSNIQSTVIDLNRQVANSEESRSYLDFICSLESPEQEYSIDRHGLHVHSLVPCQPSDEEPSTLVKRQPTCLLALGGARGIAVAALEKIGSKHSSLIITGRSELSLPAWYEPDRSVPQLRAQLIQRHREAGETVTPASIEKEIKKLAASREALTTMDRLSGIYASVTYIQVDLLDENAPATILNSLAKEGITVDSIINVAGIIEDSLVANKKQDSFRRVLSTKLQALRLTFQLLESHPIETIINFASIAGKTGNFGQSDYSAANELINAGSWLCAQYKPSLKINSVNWGPWASAGMATQDVNDAFAAKGIIPIPLEQGADCIKSLVCRQSALPLEVTVGIYDSTKFTQSDFNIETVEEFYPFLGRHSLSIQTATQNGTPTETYNLLFDSDRLPYLQSHRKFGRPVMPAAASCTFAIEAYQRKRSSSALNNQAGVLRVTTEVLSGIVFEDGVSREFSFEATGNHDQTITCKLRRSHSKRYSYRTTVEAIPAPELSRDLLGALTNRTQDQAAMIKIDQAQCYEKYLFHDGVFTVISSSPMILRESEVIVSTLRSHGTAALLGKASSHEGYLDPSLLDGLLQMGLVILRELYQTSALPNKLVVDVYETPEQGCQYLASGRIVEVNPLTSKAYYEGLITTTDGKPLLCLSYAEMTHSTSMIDEL